MTATTAPSATAGGSPLSRIGREIDLPWPTAVWVLVAHVLTILAPLLLIVVVVMNRAYLDRVLDRPELLYVSAGLLIVGSVCESAQNTLDRWYVTGAPPTLLDFLFNSLIVLSLAVSVLAVEGARAWVWWVSLGAAAIFSLAYLMGRPTRPVQMLLGLASTYLLYRALAQPVAVLVLLSTFLTLYFFDVLIRTHQQVLHGFTTLINGVGLMATVVAIQWAARGEGMSWPVVIGITLVVVGAAFAFRPALLRLPATPHKEEPVG